MWTVLCSKTENLTCKTRNQNFDNKTKILTLKTTFLTNLTFKNHYVDKMRPFKTIIYKM